MSKLARDCERGVLFAANHVSNFMTTGKFAAQKRHTTVCFQPNTRRQAEGKSALAASATHSRFRL